MAQDETTHEHYCSLIEADTCGRGGFSTTYGVNSRSVLTSLPYFDVTKCLPFDIMHTLFEGVASKVMNNLFKYLIDEGCFLNIDVINKEVRALCSSHSEGDSIPARLYRDGSSGSNFNFKQKGY